MSIVRDQYGIIVQREPGMIFGDGGDSCMRTGLMALLGDTQDKVNLLFMVRLTPPGILVRHPYQEPWNNPNNFTRDQLICWMAGAKAVGMESIPREVFKQCVKRGFRAQNTEYDYPGSTKKFPNGPDLLSPADMLFLGYCANVNIGLLCLLAVVGLPWFIASLLVATKINPEGEQNQMICQCLIYGRLATKLYVNMHRSWAKITLDYWGGWRDQAEIGNLLIDKVLETVKSK